MGRSRKNPRNREARLAVVEANKDAQSATLAPEVPVTFVPDITSAPSRAEKQELPVPPPEKHLCADPVRCPDKGTENDCFWTTFDARLNRDRLNDVVSQTDLAA